MNEGVTIQEGSKNRNISPVDRLRVNLTGGGDSYWIASEDGEADSLSVTENGFYYAVNDDCDMYDEIVVNVPAEMSEDDVKKGKTITGKDQTTGKDVQVGVDENGNLTENALPTAIHIVIAPRKLKYEDGEVLNFTGIHVYLMDSDNTRFTNESYPTGEIPFNELIFPVTVAEGGDGNSTASSDEIPDAFEFGTVVQYEMIHFPGIKYQGVADGYSAITAFQGENGSLLFLHAGASQVEGSRSYTHNGKTVYFRGAHLLNPCTNISPLVQGVESLDVRYAWAMIYGDITGGDVEYIPVQWMRSDGKTLEDTFAITIGTASEDPVPEQDPDPYAGAYDFSWGGKYYNINRSKVPEIHYANGYVWQEGISTEYSVEQAESLGLVICVG